MATFIELPRVILHTGKPSKYAVHISYDHEKFPGCYGYVEHDSNGEAGGLWFEPGPNNVGWQLDDYDGMTELPASIISTLRNAGFIVGKDFE